MTTHLLLRHTTLAAATLAVAIGLMFTSGPAQAQAERQALQLQRADGSTSQGVGAPWTPSGVENLSYRGGDEVTITHSASTEVVAGSGISCGNQKAGYTSENSFWRVFDLSEFGLTDALDVTSVDVGVESVTGPDLTSRVRLYTLDGAFTTANLTLVGEAEFTLSGGTALDILSVPVTGSFSADDVLVVEWNTEDGEPTLTTYFPGANAAGQTGPTYFSAADCGLNEPTDIAEIGFPDMHWVAVVHGTSVAGLLSIAEARAMGTGSSVIVQGTVTRAMGAFTYIQDETAGLTIRQTSGDFFDDVADGTISEGTRVRVTGTLSEFANLLQINEDDLESYEVLSDGAAPAPQAVALQELVDNGEEYEAELVRVTGLTTNAMGMFAAGTSYTVTDPTATDTLRVPNADDSDIDGTTIPEGEFIFTGVVGQFSFDDPNLGYQLLAIEETDIEAGPPPIEEAIHDTGDVQLEVYDFGEVGAYADAAGTSVGTGFVFDGDNGLYESTFLVGVSADQVSGDAYEFPDIEWATTSPLSEAEAPEGYDQAFSAGYDDSAAANPIGVEVDQFSYSATDEDYVIVEFAVENTSGMDLTGVYLGLFADWDVGDFEQNVGAYNEGGQVLYVWDNSATSANYFGVAALDGDDGVDVSGVFYDALPGDDLLYTGLSNVTPDATVPADRRTVLGVGPYDITAGETVTVQFAYVGGEDEADLLANAYAAQAAVAPPLEQAVHDTGDVQFEVFADGDLGTDGPSFEGTGFVFDGAASALFASNVLVGAGPEQVSGMAYEEGEWVTTESLAVAAPPSDFEQAFAAAFDDSGAPAPIGVEVDQLSYSTSEDGLDDFVIVEYAVENTTDAELSDIYVGVFADWDVGDATMNLGGYDEDTQLLYVYEPSGASNANYYGVAVLDAEVSGYELDAGAGDNPTEVELWAGLTTEGLIPSEATDRRTVIGSGPYTIAAGEEVIVRFAYVGGEDLDAIVANAASAQEVFIPVASEETTQAGTFALHSAYPNPFAASTTIGFTLPTAEHVRLTVYDVLGRRVATLIDGVRQAGEQAIRFDASSLGSGTYIYRLEAGGMQLTERFTVVR